MSKIITFIAVLALIVAGVLIVGISGCQTIEKPKVNDTGATIESAKTVVDANNQLAFDLYNKFSKTGNVFYSPFSISTALAMTYEGANGTTADEMKKVLHLPSENRQASFAKVINEINAGSKDYQLSTANALWAQKDFTFLDSYFNLVNNYYGGNVTNLDFKTDSENSRQTINNWVEEQTNNKIKDLIPQGVLNELTRLVLTNAIYFKGKWVMQFDEKNTKDADFKTDSGAVQAKMMELEDERFNYGESDNMQIIELPYNGNDTSMIIILPKENLTSIEASLNLENLELWKSSMFNQKVNIFIPKFKFETKYMMKPMLIEMGMPEAFSDNADFSGMTGKKDLKISQVIHQAYVDVNEEGTEAAAATAVVFEVTAINPGSIKVFRADHPFIFIIQQKDSGNILFMGRVENPNA
jgi:serpin B